MAQADTRKSARLTRRAALGLFGAAAGTAALAACAPETTTSSGTAAPTRAASTTDTSRLIVALQEVGSQQWAPWRVVPGGENSVTHEVGETLVRVNPKTGLMEGGLAESWSVAPADGTWTFKLRPNIPFHDGYGTVTAEDVKFSWGQFIQKDNIQGQAPFLSQAVGGDMKNFEIVGPLEFKLHTTKPVVYLPATLYNQINALVIQSKKYWETKPSEALVHPIGTGPYKFVSSTKGVEVQLEAVPNHWRQTSTFKAITYRIIPDDAARMAAVASGAADLAQIAPKLLGEARANGLNSISIADTSNWTLIFGGWYVGDPHYTPNAPWIQADNPEKGLAIRQAMSLAFDRKNIIDKLFLGSGKLTHAPFWEFPSNPLTLDPSWPLPTYDVAKAKQLLAQGGYPNGFEVTVPIYDRSDNAGMLDMNEMVASSLEAIGLKVKRMVADYNGVIAPQIRAKATAGWVYPATFAGRDPLGALTQTLTATATTSRMVHPTSSEALVRMAPEYDLNKRYALLRELLTAMIKDVIGIPLFLGSTPFLVSKKVGTWSPVPGYYEITNLETVTPK